MADMLEIKDIHVYYGAIHAIKGVSLTVRQGEIVTLKKEKSEIVRRSFQARRTCQSVVQRNVRLTVSEP